MIRNMKPLYKKKLYTILDVPGLTNILNPHLTGFFGLHCPILCFFVFRGMICESMGMTFSCWTFWQSVQSIL